MLSFASNDEGAENWACIASLIESGKLTVPISQAYFDVLTKLVTLWPAWRHDEFMPWAWAAEPPPFNWRLNKPNGSLHRSRGKSQRIKAV
jgi:hypothetical protein